MLVEMSRVVVLKFLEKLRIELTVKKVPWPFPEKVYAVTLWPFIFYEPHVRYDEGVLAHERYHWNHQLKWLVIPWFIVYVSLLPFYGGFRKHPIERPAYELQDSIYAKQEKKEKR